ncbi:MAG TPA: dihydrodipicolinate synthase family protein [Chthonomonadales bacterium]|nr:dihydrodipicolinate synthase family protein [Chthonomonadales bacterium]
MKSDWRGLYTAMVTPFDARGAVDPGPLADFLAFQHESGVEGVVVGGTNGEGQSLSVVERMALLEAVLGRRGALGVIAATGAASAIDAATLTRHASGAGADAALVLPPFFFPEPESTGVAAALRLALEASDIPVLLYHIPQVARVGVTPAVADQLEGHPRLAGIKDSSGCTESIRAFSRRPGWQVYVGEDRLASRTAELGAAGVISGTANAFPELVAAAVKREAGAQERLDAVLDVIGKFPAFGANRAILRASGFWLGPPRAPLIALTAEQERELIDALRALGVLRAP